MRNFRKQVKWFIGLVLVLLLFDGAVWTVLYGADEFKPALPGRRFHFPQDHFAHPEFRLEWWYYTGNARSHDGREFGYQLTFFRFGLTRNGAHRQSRWAARDLYFSHLALTDKGKESFVYREKISRGSLDQAGAAAARYHVWIDGWEVKGTAGGHVLRAGDFDLGVELNLRSEKPPVIHGQNGVSRKAEEEGYASYYYSLTKMSTNGIIYYQGQRFEVSGFSWMDHEFGSSRLTNDQVGWDWFGLQLDDNTELMLYIIRHRNGSWDPASSGTIVFPDGHPQHLKRDDFQVNAMSRWKSPHSGGSYPSGWRITIPSRNVELELVPAVKDQELVTSESTKVTYWEGSVRIRGHAGPKLIEGQGYVELTGYAPDGFGSALK